MERLTSYGYGAHLAFILLAGLILIAQSAALFQSVSLLGRRGARQALAEAAALGVLLTVTLLFGGSWSFSLAGLLPSDWIAFERMIAGVFAILAGISASMQNRRLGLPLCAAGILALPQADRFLPYSAVLILVLLGGRLILLAASGRDLLRREVTAASIREGLDLLPEGILFARADGTAVLTNIVMLDFMQQLFGQQFRNADVFWAAVQSFDEPARAEKRERGGTYLFRFPWRDSWLLQRTQLTGSLTGWQITASCVTELDAVSRELETKNALLASMINTQKGLLATLEETERHRTLQEITSRVHDVLGQRISMLQQLLASTAPKDALDTIVRIDSLLEAVPLTHEAHPETLLADMIDTYRSLGVAVTLRGQLPRNLRRTRAFAATIREALSNAVCHGRANAVDIILSERQLRIRDNGIGCTGKFVPGSGLRGMMRRINNLGGRLIITPTPHFEIDARIGRE